MTDQMQKFCTGVMLNNVKNDNRQLLLTANHCVFSDLSNAIAGFNYQRSGCGSGQITAPQTAHGMKLLAQWDKSDFALFEVQERIPPSYNVYLSGWDARNVAASNVAGIHHPSGDVKKISLFSGQLKRASWSESPSQYHWMISSWSKGVTEPGSSGSPLFSSLGQVVGQLHGGASACNNLSGSDLYGGVAFSFDASAGSSQQLKPILAPGSSLRQLNGRNLYGTVVTTSITQPTSTAVKPTVTVTTTATATVTATTTITSCPNYVCMPRSLMDRLLEELSLYPTDL